LGIKLERQFNRCLFEEVISISRDKIFAALFAIFLVMTIAFGTLYYMEHSEYVGLKEKYANLEEAFNDLKDKHEELLNDLREYMDSFVKTTIPIYNESGSLVRYETIYIPTESVSLENFTLSGVSGLIEVTVVIQYSEDNYTVSKVYVVNGSDALAATISAADVDYTIGAYGAFVNGINGVYGDWANEGTWWSFWYWDEASKTWKLSEVGPSSYKVHNGSIIAWVFTRGYPPENSPIYTPSP